MLDKQTHRLVLVSLCHNCARIVSFPFIRVSFERWPPLRGGCMSLKLPERASVHGVGQLKSEAQHGPTAKAVFFLTGAFLPDFEHGSGIGDCVYGGGCWPEKDNGPTPLGRLSSFRRPGRAALNL